MGGRGGREQVSGPSPRPAAPQPCVTQGGKAARASGACQTSAPGPPQSLCPCPLPTPGVALCARLSPPLAFWSKVTSRDVPALACVPAPVPGPAAPPRTCLLCLLRPGPLSSSLPATPWSPVSPASGPAAQGSLRFWLPLALGVVMRIQLTSEHMSENWFI